MPKSTSQQKFKVKKSGLYITKKGNRSRRISPYISVHSIARDERGSNWQAEVKFIDLDDTQCTIMIPKGKLMSPTKVIELLSSNGYQLPLNKNDKQLVCTYLASTTPDRRTLLSNSVGWHGRQVLVGDYVIGKGSETLALDTTLNESVDQFSKNGSLDDWRSSVAHLCTSSSLLIFSICAGFASPLLRFTDIGSGGFHFQGNSSIGKTTLLKAAGSVIGGGQDGYISSWWTTLTGLEETALAHCDFLLCLDELKLVDADPVKAARKACHTVYFLANDKNKTRSKAYTGMGAFNKRWSVLVLSTGEQSLAEHADQAGISRLSGEEVRLIDIPADPGCKLGIYEKLVSGFTDPAKLSEAISSGSQTHYGTPIRVFLKKLIKKYDSDGLRVRIDGLVEKFVARHVKEDAPASDRRFAKRFGLVYAGGILAVKLGVLPWKANKVRRSVDACYQAAYTNRPGNTETNRRQLIKRVCRKFSKMEGLLDFVTIKTTDYSEAELQACSGFKKKNTDGEIFFYVRRQWLLKWCKTEGQLSIILEHFEKRGQLQPGTGDDPTQQRKITGIKKRRRYYVFTADAASFKRS